MLLLESGLELLIAGSQPPTVTLREVLAAQTTDYTVIDAALDLPWGRVGGSKRSLDTGREDDSSFRRVSHRAAHHGGSLAESPLLNNAGLESGFEDESPPVLALPHAPMQQAVGHAASTQAAPTPPLSNALQSSETHSHVQSKIKAQHKPMSEAQLAAAVAKHRPCAQDLAAALRVISVLEATLAQRSALAQRRE